MLMTVLTLGIRFEPLSAQLPWLSDKDGEKTPVDCNINFLAASWMPLNVKAKMSTPESVLELLSRIGSLPEHNLSCTAKQILVEANFESKTTNWRSNWSISNH